MPVTIAYSMDTGAWAGTYPTVRDSSTGCVVQVLWGQTNDCDREVVVSTQDPDEQYPGVVGMSFADARASIQSRVEGIRNGAAAKLSRIKANRERVAQAYPVHRRRWR